MAVGGVLAQLLGGRALGQSVVDVAQVFRPHETRALELQSQMRAATMAAFAAEFEETGGGTFDRVINGLNRLPRPCLAFGTIGLFVFAMVDPVAFAGRMVGLEAVPEPLWWLLGAIVGFYFGARELHYFRRQAPRKGLFRRKERQAAEPDPQGPNAAISAWQNGMAAE